ncbi:M14 family metallopeptidase [Alicyclobacillus herbarius]|uniref:M14 family metallopeptidase n=1 Tax=Alicyclobacillus herbarius TaxID=122960 RepID=UPI00040F1738|nr:M14 family metallopeptidase [Alicyclobacillus herbarius]
MDGFWSTGGIFASRENHLVPRGLRRRITIPSHRTIWETAAIVEVAARIGFHLAELREPFFDSLFVFDRLDDADAGNSVEGGVHLVLGTDEVWLTQVLGDGVQPLLRMRGESSEDRGIVYPYRDEGKTIVVVTGTKPETTLLAARYLVTNGFGEKIDIDHPVIFISPEQAPQRLRPELEDWPPKSNFSLHNVFTTEGIYHTSDGDVHPSLDVTFLLNETKRISGEACRNPGAVYGASNEEMIAAVELAVRMAMSAGSMTFPVTCCPGEETGMPGLLVSICLREDSVYGWSAELAEDRVLTCLHITGGKDKLVSGVREIIRDWFDPPDIWHGDTWRQRFAMLRSPSRDVHARAQLAMMAFVQRTNGRVTEIRVPAHLAQPAEFWDATGVPTVHIEQTAPAWTLEWADPGEMRDMEEFVEKFFRGRRAGDVEKRPFTIEIVTTVSASTFVSFAERMRERLRNTFGVQVHFVYRNANKSGLHWFMHEVLPELRRVKGLHSVEVAARAFRPDVKYLDRPYRFLQDLYPADELLVAEIGIPKDRIHLRLLEEGAAPMFQVRAFDAHGLPLGTWTWEGWTETALYMPEKPELGRVLVPAAGCRIYEGNLDTPVASQSFATNPFRFWKWYQSVLPQIERRPDLHEGTPKFMQLECHVTLDAEDEEIPYREEVNSCLEALHEDIYFYSLHAFYEYGLSVSDLTWNAPGGILPFIHAEPGCTPHAIIKLYTFPTVDEITIVSGDTKRVVRPMDRRVLEGARIIRLTCDDGGRHFTVAGVTEAELARGLETWLGAAADSDGNADHPRGLGRNAEGTLLRGSAIDDSMVDKVILVNQDVAQWLDRNRGTIPGRAIRLDYSFQGEWIWFVELYAGRRERSISSPVKHSLYKPTLFINARHHANEVSSTNAALRLVRDVADDGRVLEFVNLVLVPLENVDGANLHFRMASEHPKWKLHAARYNACGLEFQEYRFHPDTMFGESRVYPKVWDRWKPDIAIDDHGIPSHEWIQPFSGYSSPPRFPVSYWIPSARMYTIWRKPTAGEQIFNDALASLRGYVTESLDKHPDVARDNAAWLDTYRRWGNEFDPDYFPVELSHGSIAHTWESCKNPESPTLVERFPNWITADIITEVNDETVQGEELRACADAHLVVNKSVIEWMVKTTQRVEVSAERLENGKIRVRMERRRPIL